MGKMHDSLNVYEIQTRYICGMMFMGGKSLSRSTKLGCKLWHGDLACPYIRYHLITGSELVVKLRCEYRILDM